MTLREIQDLMFAALRWPTGVSDFLENSSEETRRAFEHTFAQTREFDRVARVQVYADAYFWRLADVAVDQYPATAFAAGAKPFHNFLTDFVLAHPSTTPDVRHFAAGLSAALRKHPLATRVPGIAALAALERAVIVAVDAPDELLVRRQDLAEIPLEAWPSLVFQLAATVAVLECPLDYAALRDAADASPPPLHRSLPQPHPGQHFVVWRGPDFDVYHRRLDSAETHALLEVQRGGTWSSVCATAAQLDASVDAQTAAQWLARWVDDGMLRRAKSEP